MITKSIPNMCTLGNLFLGMIAILLAVDGKYSLAAIMVIVAMLLDGLDGRMARVLNAQSEFGKELDSLSDMISLVLLPQLLCTWLLFMMRIRLSLGRLLPFSRCAERCVWLDLTYVLVYQVILRVCQFRQQVGY